MLSLEILAVEDLHLLVGLLPVLVVLDELFKYFSHELIVLLHEAFFLLQLFAVAVQVLLHLLLAHVFEDALHLLVGGRRGELGERHNAELTGRGRFCGSGLVFDHAIESFEVVDGLQVLEGEADL